MVDSDPIRQILVETLRFLQDWLRDYGPDENLASAAHAGLRMVPTRTTVKVAISTFQAGMKTLYDEYKHGQEQLSLSPFSSELLQQYADLARRIEQTLTKFRQSAYEFHAADIDGLTSKEQEILDLMVDFDTTKLIEFFNSADKMGL